MANERIDLPRAHWIFWS